MSVLTIHLVQGRISLTSVTVAWTRLAQGFSCADMRDVCYCCTLHGSRDLLIVLARKCKNVRHVDRKIEISWIGLSEDKLQDTGSKACLSHIVKQGDGVIACRKTRRQGYYIHQNKDAGLANFGKNSLCRKEVFRF